MTIIIAESAQPRNCSIVTRPFSSWEGGVWEWDYICLCVTAMIMQQRSAARWIPWLRKKQLWRKKSRRRQHS